jgi:hypothetical protein
VKEIRDFAISSMNPASMFWRVREPYFSDEVLQAIWSRKLPAAEAFYSTDAVTLQAPPKAPVAN